MGEAPREDCAENVSGVTNVQNNLRIETADTGHYSEPRTLPILVEAMWA